MIIGRWSDPMARSVSHSANGSRAGLTREKSGELGCRLEGSLVELSVLSTPKLESPISSAKSLPLVSWFEEYHRESCALKSPSTMALPGGAGE